MDYPCTVLLYWHYALWLCIHHPQLARFQTNLSQCITCLIWGTHSGEHIGFSMRDIRLDKIVMRS